MTQLNICLNKLTQFNAYMNLKTTSTKMIHYLPLLNYHVATYKCKARRISQSLSSVHPFTTHYLIVKHSDPHIKTGTFQ